MNIIRKTFTYSVIFQAVVWIILSIIYFFNSNSNILIFALMVVNGICFFVLSLLLDSSKIFRIGIFLFLLINLILTFTDQMGVYDYLVLVLNIISLTAFFIYIAKQRNKSIES